MARAACSSAWTATLDELLRRLQAATDRPMLYAETAGRASSSCWPRARRPISRIPHQVDTTQPRYRGQVADAVAQRC